MASDDAFSIDTSDLAKLALDFNRFQLIGKHRTRERLNYWGGRLQNDIRRRASGRPGPNIITGQYVRTIMVRRSAKSEEFGITAFSAHPAAHRLEYGYVGRDSLGRNVNAPPYPHFGPALEHITPLMVADMADHLAKWWKE